MWMIVLALFAVIGLGFVLSLVHVQLEETRKKRARYFASVFKALEQRQDVAKDVAGRPEIQGIIAWCWRKRLSIVEAVEAAVDRAQRGMVTGEERYFLGEHY